MNEQQYPCFWPIARESSQIDKLCEYRSRGGQNCVSHSSVYIKPTNNNTDDILGIHPYGWIIIGVLFFSLGIIIILGLLRKKTVLWICGKGIALALIEVGIFLAYDGKLWDVFDEHPIVFLGGFLVVTYAVAPVVFRWSGRRLDDVIVRMVRMTRRWLASVKERSMP